MAVQAGFSRSLPPLFGREEALIRLGAALSQTSLLTLTGSGGVGKTRLAQRLAHDAQPMYPGGVWWANLAALTEPDALADHICAAIGAPGPPKGSAVDRLREFVSDRTILLVLDNCEHVIEEVAFLCESFLQACPCAQILATSREALSVSCEIVWPVPSLTVPSLRLDTALADLDSCGAVQLFAYRARSIAPDFELTDQNRDAVARICRRLDGLPLALELAASCLNTLSVEQLDTELAQTNHILVHGLRTAHPRHRSLEATIEWSYNWLNADEQALFRRLCMLSDTFDLELAARVGGFERSVMLNHLKRLVDKSLVQLVSIDGAPHYRILQTLTQFGRERLSLLDEAYELSLRYCDWGRALVQAAVRATARQRDRNALDSLELNLGHLRGILHWMLDQGLAQEAVAWVTALQGFWRERGRLNEGMRWLEAGLARQDAISPLVRARALLALGVYASWQGDNCQAKTYCREALQLFGDLQRPRGVAMSLLRLGSAEQRSGEYEDALAHLRMSLETFAALGDGEGVTMARYRLGLVALAQCDSENAVTQLEECLGSLRARGDVGGCAATLMSLGVAELERGALDEAEQLLRESLERNRALKDTFAVGYALIYLGQAAYLQRRFADARACLSEALALADTASTPELLARLFDGVALLAARDSDLRNAACLWGASEAIQRAYDVRYWPIERDRRAVEMKSARRRAGEQAQEKTFAAALGAGQEMTLEGAFTLARNRTQVGVAFAPKLNAEGAQERSVWIQASTDISPQEAAGVQPLHIRALGAVHVQCGEREVTQRDFTYTKALELLLYLIHHGPRTKQQIGLALWPDISEEQFRTTFRVVVYHLRRALGHVGRVRKERGQYLIVREPEDWYDVEAFDTAILEAERCRPGDVDEAIARLEAARAVYRGDFCDSITATDWLIEAQDALKRKQIAVLITLGYARLERGHPKQALERFKEALNHDRYCEDAHRGVLRSYLLLHDHSQAAQYFQQLRLQFERELGVPLAPETRAVLQSVRES
jgi:predicted ATPase/DNA-binding SARP family transcriptional activator